MSGFVRSQGPNHVLHIRGSEIVKSDFVVRFFFLPSTWFRFME